MPRFLGYGATSDAYHMTAPHPEGEGSTNAMRFALEEAFCRSRWTTSMPTAPPRSITTRRKPWPLRRYLAKAAGHFVHEIHDGAYAWRGRRS